MKELFYRALEVKRNLRTEDYLMPSVEVTTLHRELDALLAVDSSAFHPKEQAFIQRLIKHKEGILAFLTHPEVPVDNNASERAIRNVKVRPKYPVSSVIKKARELTDLPGFVLLLIPLSKTDREFIPYYPAWLIVDFWLSFIQPE
ncbi:hypothetical protein AGMMS49574_12030 [Bacteroidia bacterium]|nr:hypothetical protein AGMMS49574_12030 [Bacteroidia bacterium]GHV04151.1 hypothetical protein FACS189416_1880 [Bacteroidia bacterium]